jgi:hypothetical protein
MILKYRSVLGAIAIGLATSVAGGLRGLPDLSSAQAADDRSTRS